MDDLFFVDWRHNHFYKYKYSGQVNLHIPGTLYRYEFPCLLELVKLAPQGYDILELDSMCGRVTQILAQVHSQSQVYAMDPWQEYSTIKDLPLPYERYHAGFRFHPRDVYKIFQREILDIYPNVHTIRGRFPQDLPENWNPQLSIFYTDCLANYKKNYSVDDCLWAWDHLVPQGLWIGNQFYDKPEYTWRGKDFALSVAERLGVEIHRIHHSREHTAGLWYIIKP